MSTGIANKIGAVTNVTTPDLVAVQSTVHLKGLRLGEEVFVDPTDPYMVACLEAGYLVRVKRVPSGESVA